jgi:hypothetical protein
MKLKSSALSKAINKKNLGHQPQAQKANQQQEKNVSSKTQPVKSSSQKSDMKHGQKTHKKEESYREKTQELLERNFRKMKSLQKPVLPLMVAEPTFVLPPRPEVNPFQELDNSVLKDQVIPSLNHAHSQSLPTEIINNKFQVLNDLAEEEEAKKPAFFVHEATFQFSSSVVSQVSTTKTSNPSQSITTSHFVEPVQLDSFHENAEEDDDL